MHRRRHSVLSDDRVTTAFRMTTVRWRGETYEINQKADRVQVPWPWRVPPRRLFGRKYINRGADRRLETWVEVGVRIEKEAKQAEDQVRA